MPHAAASQFDIDGSVRSFSSQERLLDKLKKRATLLIRVSKLWLAMSSARSQRSARPGPGRLQHTIESLAAALIAAPSVRLLLLAAVLSHCGVSSSCPLEWEAREFDSALGTCVTVRTRWRMAIQSRV